MEFKIIWDITWRRKWIILQGFVTIFFIIVAGSFLLPVKYESKSIILFEKSTTGPSLWTNIGLEINKAATTNADDYSLENNIAIATSKPILNTLISNLKLSDSRGNLLKPDDIADPGLLKKISKDPFIEVEAVDDTDLFEIISTSTNPDEAAMIANTIAKECINYNLRLKKDEFEKAELFIVNNLKTAREKYIMALNAVKTFSKEQKSLDVKTETTNAVSRISELMKEKQETIIELSEAQAGINELQKQLNEQDQYNVLGTTSDGNNYIEELRTNIINYEMELEEALVEKRKDHPDVKILEQKLKKARSELNHEILLSKQYSTELLKQKRALAVLKVHLTGLNKDIDVNMSEFSSMSEKNYMNAQLQLDIEVNEGLYQSMLEYLYQIRIAQTSIFSDLRVIEEASAQDIDDPESPSRVLYSLAGIFLGLIWGFTLGFFLEYMDETIKTREDIKKLGANLLGMVPKFRQKGYLLIAGKSSRGYLNRDHLTEVYRSIRNSIDFSCYDKPINTLLVTSPENGEGKTTTALNLAISMTYQDKNVLVFDADYRNPKVHEIFGLKNDIGSTNVLTKQADINEALQKSGIDKLSVLTTGPISSDPARLIESEKMKELINDLSSIFDMVVMDSSSIMAFNDAVILGRIVDGVVSIAECSRETYLVFNQAMENFTKAGIKPIGIVLNRFR